MEHTKTRRLPVSHKAVTAKAACPLKIGERHSSRGPVPARRALSPLPCRRHPGVDPTLYDAAAELALHRRHPREATCCARRPKEGCCHCCAQRIGPAALVEVERMAGSLRRAKMARPREARLKKRAESPTYQAKPRAPFAHDRRQADRCNGSRYRARFGRRAPRFEGGRAGAYAHRERSPGSFDEAPRAPRPMRNPAPRSVRDLRGDCSHMRTPNAPELARVARRGLASQVCGQPDAANETFSADA